MDKKLLEECGLFISCPSYFTKDQHIDLLYRIKSELAKPEPEPVAWSFEINGTDAPGGWSKTLDFHKPEGDGIRNIQELYINPSY